MLTEICRPRSFGNLSASGPAIQLVPVVTGVRLNGCSKYEYFHVSTHHEDWLLI